MPRPATLLSFLRDESGRLSMDWLLLYAAIIGLGLVLVSTMRSGVGRLATDDTAPLTEGGSSVIQQMRSGG